MNDHLRGRLRSFGFAFNGWVHLLQTQPNVRIHLVVLLAVLFAGIWLALSRLEWAVITLTSALVLGAEAINTAFEAVVDLASPAQHPKARIAKDVAAGAVLLCACAAVIVGLLVLGPPLLSRLLPIVALR